MITTAAEMITMPTMRDGEIEGPNESSSVKDMVFHDSRGMSGCDGGEVD